MNITLHKSALAVGIACMITLPAWSANDPVQLPEKHAVTTEQSTTPSKSYAVEEKPAIAEKITNESLSRNDTANPLLSITPDDLYQRDVIGSSDEKIGHVSDVVSHKTTGEIYGVISTGGFLGVIGGTRHIIPLAELSFEDNKLHLNATQEELTQRERYVDERFTTVQPHDRPISEFSAFEQGR